MKKLLKFLFWAAVIIGFIGFLVYATGFVGTYNKLVVDNQVVETAWSQVETQYQRRFDLIPGIVGATKGTMQQEKDVFGAIADARTHYANAKTTDEKVAATNQVEGALARLLVVMENYPQLKSIDSVKILTDELAGTENRILVARDRYNEQVRIWNGKVKIFPTNIYAPWFGFKGREYFKSDADAKNAPEVDLSTKAAG